jgi:hypothetical protein
MCRRTPNSASAPASRIAGSARGGACSGTTLGEYPGPPSPIEARSIRCIVWQNPVSKPTTGKSHAVPSLQSPGASPSSEIPAATRISSRRTRDEWGKAASAIPHLGGRGRKRTGGTAHGRRDRGAHRQQAVGAATGGGRGGEATGGRIGKSREGPANPDESELPANAPASEANLAQSDLQTGNSEGRQAPRAERGDSRPVES